MITEVTPLATTVATALTIGYTIGRHRIGGKLVNWADAVLGKGVWRTWRFIPAISIAYTAVALLWTFRPRRTLNNYRSWKEAEQRTAPGNVVAAGERSIAVGGSIGTASTGETARSRLDTT